MLTTSTGRSAPALGGDAQGAQSAGGLRPLAGMLRWIVIAVLTIAVALPILSLIHI